MKEKQKTPYQQKFDLIAAELKNLQIMIDKEVIPLHERALDESTEHLMKTQQGRNKLKEENSKLIEALKECADDLKRMKRNEAARIESNFDRCEKFATEQTDKYYSLLESLNPIEK